MSETLRCEFADDIAHVTLDRPGSLNALTKAMKLEIAGLFRELGADPGVRGVVISGAGDRAFSAGSDVKEMSGFGGFEAEAMLNAEHECFDAVLRCPRPVIAAVHGYALGAGCQLAMCADICLATPDAVFGMPELRFGAVNGNETALFLHFGGLGLARRLILGCETMQAPEAATWGIVTQVVADKAALLPRAIERAKALAAYPGAAYRRQKELVLGWLDQPYSPAVAGSIAAAAMAWEEPEIIAAMGSALTKPGKVAR